MKVLLGNIDYKMHMTNEGDQLQEGLRSAGWHLSGSGFDNLQDCEQIVLQHDPSHIIVHDKRDWDPRNYWAFRRDIGYQNLEALKAIPNRIGLVKDAGSMVEYHRYFCVDELDCTGVITYYHDKAVLPHNPWLEGIPRYRTYHSIDARYIHANCRNWDKPRKGTILTGAANAQVYPLRAACSEAAQYLEIYPIGHPGYSNSGTRSNIYLETLQGFKCHIATASAYNFALRKIIESVAVGCTPITNLPEWDYLPEIDEALVRVPSDISMSDMRDVLRASEASWNRDERLFYAGKACVFYDYQAIGRRLNVKITQGENHESGSIRVGGQQVRLSSAE